MKKMIRIFAAVMLSVSLSPVWAEPAGTMRLVLGKVLARTGDGGEHRLFRGAPFSIGDTIVTSNRGRAQLQFEDSSFVSLNPDSSFRVDDFKHVTGQTGNNFAVSLAKGGMRMVTGGIGKQEPRAVLIKTTVATIGIRGTGFTLQICDDDCYAREGGDKAPDGLYAYVTDGVIVLSNEAGELDVPRGKGVFVKNAQTAPVFTPVHPLALPVAVTDPGMGPVAEAAEEAAGETPAGTQVSASPYGKSGEMAVYSSSAPAVFDTAPGFQSGEQVTADGVTATLPVGSITLDVQFQ